MQVTTCCGESHVFACLVQVVTDYFNSRLDAVKPQPSSAADAQPGWSVERLLELVQGFAQGWRADRLRPFPELR